jgi:ribosomal protein L29
MPTKSPAQIQAQIEKLKAELLQIGAMRPGSLSQQYTACQKPGCKCVDPVRPQKHGPFYKLSYTHRGKSSTQFIRPQFVEEVRRQLAAYKKFKSLTEKWVALALELSKTELEQARSATPKARWPEAPELFT